MGCNSELSGISQKKGSRQKKKGSLTSAVSVRSAVHFSAVLVHSETCGYSSYGLAQMTGQLEMGLTSHQNEKREEKRCQKNKFPEGLWLPLR